MKKFFILAVTLLALAACKEDPFKNASVLTLDATEVTKMGATLNGFFKPDKEGYLAIPAFLLSKNSNSLTIEGSREGEAYLLGDEDAVIGNNRSSFTIIDWLEPGTTYYYRAVLYYYSEEMDPGEVFVLADNVCRFTTLPMKMDLVSEPAANIGPFSATLCGTLDTEADSDLQLAAWFLFGDENATMESLKEEDNRLSATLSAPDADGKRHFTFDKDGLSLLTTYSYVACAKVGRVEFYGELVHFTTQDSDITLTTEDPEVGAAGALLKASLSEDLRGKDRELWFLLGPADASLEQLISEGTRIDCTIGEDFSSFQARTPLLELTTSYSYAAFAIVFGEKSIHGSVKTFTTIPREVPEDAVEMGLSVLWAKKNLGADSPETPGGYYCFGETETKADYSLQTYKWCNGEESGANGYIKYCISWLYGPDPDGKLRLDPEDDAATAILGAPWRTPSRSELQELIDYCDWTPKESDGHPGYEITSRITGNSIYLLQVDLRNGTTTQHNYSSGYYLSCEIDGFFNNYSYALLIRTDSKGTYSLSNYRYYGYQIRPVRD